MELERPASRAGSHERPVTRWRREERPVSRNGVPDESSKATGEDRPVSRRGFKVDMYEVGYAIHCSVLTYKSITNKIRLLCLLF